MVATITIIVLCAFGVLLAVRLDRAEHEADRWRTEAKRLEGKCAAAERDKHDLYCDGLRLAGEVTERRRATWWMFESKEN